MNRRLSRVVRERARHRCEYCLLPEAAFPLPFQIDHVLAQKHGEKSIESNLALACTHCNAHKGPNIAGVDQVTGQVVRLFSPRTDVWDEHFQISGPFIKGRTAAGRVTVAVLALNDADQLLIRSALMREIEA
ncbi:MAG: HNH endonuclease [Acidobacteriaceae bacterium]|nr:HNH endonuclease [Acidobacteriaceae bacterium]